MAPPGAESQTLRDLFGEDLDKRLITKVTANSSGPMCPSLPPSLVKTTKVVHLVLERGAANTLTALRNSPDVTSKAEIITNPLDEQQQQQQVAREDRMKRRSETLAHLAQQRGYVFHAPSDEERLRGATGRSLSG